MPKIVVVGDQTAGKNRLLFSYVQGPPGEYVPTVFENFTTAEIIGEQTVGLGLWSTEGQEGYERLRLLSYPRTDVFLVCFSINKPATFNNVATTWIPELRKHCPRVPIILVGTEMELRNYPANTAKRITAEQGQQLAGQIKALRYTECSAVTGQGVRELFQEAAKIGMAKSSRHRSTSSLLMFSSGQPRSLVLANETQHRDFNSVVFAAAGKGHIGALHTALETHRHLIDTPDNDGNTPMHNAVKNGNFKAVEALVRAGSRAIDTSGMHCRTPMHEAASNGNVKMIETLVRLGSQAVDATTNHGRTPLHEAACWGHVRAVDALVQLGSRAVDARTADGTTPLHEAAANGHVEVIETLVRLGSEAVDTPDNDGRTPMHMAAQNAHAEVIETLVRLGSSAVNTRDRYNATPMAIALRGQALSPSVLGALVAAGADLALGLRYSDSQQCKEVAEVTTKLKEGVGALKMARYFDVRKCALSFRGANLSNDTAGQLPMRNWQSCERLDFRGNPHLTEIPASLAVLGPDRIKKIAFDPPTTKWSTLEAQTASSDDSRAIIEYAKLKAEGGLLPINERKLMAVGYAAVGKTTLVRRLKDEDYTHPLSTDGVDMGELTLRMENDQPMRVVVWDFAGQPLYRQTHLLFLRNPGLCLLLFKLTDDVETNVEQLRYWCDTLRSVTGNSKSQSSQALLVGTHLDRVANRNQAQQHAEQVWRRLQGSLAFSEPPVLVSCAEGRENKQTIGALRDAILQMAQKMDVRAPSCIEMARSALQSAAVLQIPLLPIASAHDILVSYATQMGYHQLTCDAHLREMCLRALQTLGSAMVLEERGRITHVVANPQWVALLLATVVTTRHTWVTRGRVTFGTLSSQVWRGHDRFPVEIHSTLVAILEQLKVMFPMTTRKGTAYSHAHEFFIPSSLPEQRPHFQFRARTATNPLSVVASLSNRLVRIFKLTEARRSIPVGVLPSIVVQLMSMPRIKMLEAWQQGGTFRIKSSTASATVSVCKQASDTIEVTVRSSLPRLRAEWIRDVSTMVENQLTDVFHLEFDVRIPCTDEDDSCYLTLDALRSCVIQKRLQASCQPDARHHTRLDLLAPDLLFTDLGFHEFVRQWSAVDLLSELGKGAFAKVMLGRLDAVSPRSRSSSSSVSSSPAPSSTWLPSSPPTSPRRPPSGPIPSSSSASTWQPSSPPTSPRLPSSPPTSPRRPASGPISASSSSSSSWQPSSPPTSPRRLSSGPTSPRRPSSRSSSFSAESELVAVKVLQNSDHGSSKVDTYREFQHEAYLMSLLQHPNIVRFVGVCFPSDLPHSEHENSSALLMELVDGGTLYQALNDTVGLLSICDLAVGITDCIGGHNVALSVYQAKPANNPQPAPLLPLGELCDGALGRINQVFNQRLFSRPLEGIESEINDLQQLQRRLNEQLALFYQGPVTREVHLATDEVIEKIRGLAEPTNRLLVSIDWQLRLKLATDVAQGLMYLHTLSPPLVHRDFKSPNVFLRHRLDSIDLSKFDWSQPLAKVGDFGLSIRMLATTELQVSERHIMNDITPTWAAPEVLSKCSYTTQADVYAMGIILWELLVRKHPFLNVRLPVLAQHVVEGGRPLLPATLQDEDDPFAEEYIQLVQECWHQDPNMRPPMVEVCIRLGELCRRVAPDVFASLPDLGAQSANTQHPLQQTSDGPDKKEPTRRFKVTNMEIVSVNAEGAEPKVLCMQVVDVSTVWLGMSTGDVLALQFDQSEYTTTACSSAERHQKTITALSFNNALQSTVWTGAKDGRIFVWSAEIEQIEAARLRCYLKSRFVVANSTVRQLTKYKGRALHCVLRNGWLHCYPDEHVGPSCFELDLCRVNIVATLQGDGKLEVVVEGTRLMLQPVDADDSDAEDSVMRQWLRTIMHLSQLARDGRGLSRLAVSAPKSMQESITALEATDEATWALTPTTLTEWQLLATQHGLHGQLRLEPGRSLTFDMSCEQFSVPRLRQVCGLAWVAPKVLWVGAANAIAYIDLTQRFDNSSSSSSPSSPSSPASSPTSSSELLTINTPLACHICSRVHEGVCSPRSASSSRFAAMAMIGCGGCGKQFSVLRRKSPCRQCSAPLCNRCAAASYVCKHCQPSQSSPPSPSPSPLPVSRSPPPLLLSVLMPDRQSRSPTGIALRWPSSAAAHVHSDPIWLLTMVESSESLSGHEVWTYAPGENLCVWQTPISYGEMEDQRRSVSSSSSVGDDFGPRLIARVPLSSSAPMLTCMAQVGNQMWAGTRDGTIIGWDIASRCPLAEIPVPKGSQELQSTSAISTARISKHTVMAFSSIHATTLRKFTLTSFPQPQPRLQPPTDPPGLLSARFQDSPMVGSVQARRSHISVTMGQRSR